MQTGKIIPRKVTLIKLEGHSNADNPLKITGDQLDAIFQVDVPQFDLYTQGPITGRRYFGTICRGTWQAYESHQSSGQKSVILSRAY